MRNKFILLIVAGFSLFISSAFAREQVPQNQPAASSSRPAVPHRGMLYRIERQGKTAYLFGTFHAGHSAFYPLDAQTMKALSGSGRLIVEFDPRNTAAVTTAMAKYSFYQGDERLDRHLSASALQRLKRVLPRFGLTFEQVANMKPWMIANLLIGLEADRGGISLQNGVESYLLELADRHEQKVEELETADYQLSLFAELTPMQQENYLLETISEIESGEADHKTKRLARAWSRAESPAFEAAFQEIMTDKTETAAFTRTVLLKKRNNEMTVRIGTLLRNDKPSFVAVGLLHLLGDDGLPNLLRKQGYTVQKLH